MMFHHDSPAPVGNVDQRYQLNKRAKTQAQFEQTRKRLPALRLASWNVRTLCTGLNSYTSCTEDIKKTVVIDRELSRFGIDIACLQETRLADNGKVVEANYTFVWQGLPSDRPRQQKGQEKGQGGAEEQEYTPSSHEDGRLPYIQT